MDLRVQPGLYNQFQASQGYKMRLYQKKEEEKKEREKEKRKRKRTRRKRRKQQPGGFVVLKAAVSLCHCVTCVSAAVIQ